MLVCIYFIYLIKCASMEERLKVLKSNKDAISPAESKKINEDYEHSVRHWRKRKRMVCGYCMSRKTIWILI